MSPDEIIKKHTNDLEGEEINLMHEESVNGRESNLESDRYIYEYFFFFLLNIFTGATVFFYVKL